MKRNFKISGDAPLWLPPGNYSRRPQWPGQELGETPQNRSAGDVILPDNGLFNIC